MQSSVLTRAAFLVLFATTLIILLLLVRTNSTLAATKGQLSASQGQVQELSIRLGAVNERLAAETAQVGTLSGDLSEVKAQLAASMSEIAGLKSELEVTSNKLAAEFIENETLSANLLATTKELGGKTSDLDKVTRQLANKSADYDSLLGEVDSLEDLRADRDGLLSEIDSLKTSIRLLEELREPLIVRSFSVGFRCTGSMEPKITCLDSATWLRNFNPEDVTVGSVIIFTPTPECEIGLGTTSHRVLEIREVEGTYYYYWPKGDANADADGCWISDANVYGYMTELHKNTRPENGDLRNRVNAAISHRDETLSKYKAAEEAYNQRYEEYCGHNPDACTLDQERVSELDRLYDEYIRLFNIHQEAFDAWNAVNQEALNTY